MRALLNTNLFPILNVGMYNSEISPDTIFDSGIFEQNREEGYIHYDEEYYWDNFDYDKYKKEIVRIASETLSDVILENGIEIKIKVGELYSPKEYNFATDNVDLIVTFNKNKVLKFAKDNEEVFNGYLHKKYSSYDGFWSLTANNYEDWYIDFKDNEERAIAAILCFIFDVNFESYQSSFIEQCYSKLYYSNFVEETGAIEEMAFIKNYIQNMYIDFEIDCMKNDYPFGFLNEKEIEKYSNYYINLIEDKTYELL